MKRAAIVSLIIHMSLFLVLLLGLSNPLDNLIKDNRPMVIDFINVADVSAAPKLSAMNQKKQDALKPTPEIKPVETTPPPMPTKTLETKEPEKKEEDKPLPKPEKKPDPKHDPDAMPILKKEAKKKEPPKKLDKKPEQKKEEKKKDTSKKTDLKKDNEKKKDKKSDDKALVNLHKSKTSDPKKKIDPKAKSSPKTIDDLTSKLADVDGAEQQESPAETIASTITANEMDAVDQTIGRCRSLLHIGAIGADSIKPEIYLKIAPDGTVKHAEIIDKSRMARDPVFRAKAEDAKRAALDPKCNPLPLPPHKYNQWKETILVIK